MRRLLLTLVLAMFAGTLATAQNAPSPPSPAQSATAPSPAELSELVQRLRNLEVTNKKLLQDAEDSKRLRDDFKNLSNSTVTDFS